ncbi:SDR family NAD(P)-dependent oxidoreductase [Ferdinandcohnia quinoae]|uniref:SDR family NAD(P)-dependent oxidoreductase n=1 Tax=Fredinandcohnia quinoae TaxID=2918902 RepID=A0AAW5EFY8_9BACI|nr:SDR family NAD(P)-dependent oxidoreductase [Fredinandcohnia sp. SECRCQ15]MCH1627759.1 SDR family NAD(P)-dependent oxidoreductase [Fredinandcohnia sp. SECRCQ15]
MKKALVLGASGGMGYAIVEELSGRDINVVAFARTREKLTTLFGRNKKVEICSGDVFNKEDLAKAAEGVDVIFHAINIPYGEWAAKQPTLMKNVVGTAESANVKLAIVDNIYAYGRSSGGKVNEDSPKNPHTKKGKIRVLLGKIADQAKIPVLTAHFPDFYGPNTENAMLTYTFEKMVQQKKAMFVGNQNNAREYLYTPDGAKAIVDLAMHEHAYGQHWNIPATEVITGKEIIKIAKQHLSYEKDVSTVTKGMIRLLGIFDKQMREVVEMLYLTEEPVVLDGSKYEREIGKLPTTPYEEGIGRTLDYMRQYR